MELETITSAVGCFPAGRTVAGCEDMSGNVGEWTRSLRAGYPYPDDSQGRRAREDLNNSGLRVLRGGAFYYDVYGVRCAVRRRGEPDDRANYIGFRAVLSPFL